MAIKHDTRLERGNQMIQEREAIKPAIPPCSLDYYREIVRVLTGPSIRQIDNFIKFVCSAHSWYKHLPILQPGIQFTFFLDPFSGMDKILKPGGHVIHRERTEDTPKFHYTWMTTNDYRSRFGYLSYMANAGTGFFLQVRDEVSEYADLPIIVYGTSQYRIPPEVAQVGSVELTAAIHPNTPKWLRMHVYVKGESVIFNQGHRIHDGLPLTWSSETGGEEIINKIISISKQPLEYKTREEYLSPINQIDNLILPERSRQQKEIKSAIHRMLTLVFSG